MTFQTTALILAWIAIILLGFAMSGLLHQLQVLTAAVGGGRTTAGPALGLPAPMLDGLGGEAGWRAPTIVLFLESGCKTCRDVLNELPALAGAHESGVDFAVVFGDAGFADAEDERIRLLPNQPKAFADFEVPLTPFAVLVDGNGLVVAREPLGSREALRQFVGSMRERVMSA
jgi:hypothetical protein